MRDKFVLAVLASVILAMTAGCAGSGVDKKAALASLSEEQRKTIVIQSDCIYSMPAKATFSAYRQFGVCFVSQDSLRIYSGGKKPPAMVYDWPIISITEYAFHTDTFTMVTAAGNFGLVLDDAPQLIAVLRNHQVTENRKLPLFKAKDTAPYDFIQ